MRKTWSLGGATILLAIAATAGRVVVSSAQQAPPSTQDQPANTANVQRGNLAAMVSVRGTLTYHARLDGSPYSVINQALGKYTELPDDGDKIECGDVLYRVDNTPVLLLCGAVPAYRDLHFGDVGKDVGQLNRNLHMLGYDAKAGVDINPDDNVFTNNTVRAFQLLRHDKGFSVTGVLAIGEAVFLPDPVRIAKVNIKLGGSAQPGAQVMDATSNTPEVQVNLEPSQQGEVKEGDPAQIALPGQQVVMGKVARLGRVAQVPAAQLNDDRAAAATIPAYISLDDPANASGLDKAPVQVTITTRGVENALSVPVTALVGKSGGGFAVEVVRPDARRELVTVKLGLFDTAGGRVQVEGDLGEGDQVVVPSL
jgi:peptidoglycan hydrolase-like protein with peptidoglycan-binding domain